MLSQLMAHVSVSLFCKFIVTDINHSFIIITVITDVNYSFIIIIVITDISHSFIIIFVLGMDQTAAVSTLVSHAWFSRSRERGDVTCSLLLENSELRDKQ